MNLLCNIFFGTTCILGGNFSALMVDFILQREIGQYILEYYVPSLLLVSMSWVSFWLDPNAVPGR